MPAKAPIGRLSPWVFDPIEAGRDLDALEILLTPKTPLSERDKRDLRRKLVWRSLIASSKP